jgi:hypothetical protein
MEMNGTKKSEPKQPQELSLEQIAMLVLEDPMTAEQVAELTGIAVNKVRSIPFKDLPYVATATKSDGRVHRLYGKKLVAKFLAKMTKIAQDRRMIA